MKHVAYLTTNFVDDAPVARGALPRGDGAEFALLAKACAARDVSLHPEPWQTIGAGAGYDGAIIRSTWGYPAVWRDFVAAMEKIRTPLLNDAATVAWNVKKSYLGDLGARGAPLTRLAFLPQVDADSLDFALESLAADEIVVKPLVGAGAWRQARIKRGDPFPSADLLPPDEAVAQPYLPAIAAEGEISMLYFAGVFSHACLKRAKPGDYRTQGRHGASESPYTPSTQERDAAERVLAAFAQTGHAAPLYARVDIARGLQGAPVLMELELIEPVLYLAFDGADGARAAGLFADALAARLG